MAWETATTTLKKKKKQIIQYLEATIIIAGYTVMVPIMKRDSKQINNLIAMVNSAAIE